MHHDRPLEFRQSRLEIGRENPRVSESLSVQIDKAECVADFLFERSIVVVSRTRQNGVHSTIERIHHKSNRNFAAVRFDVITGRRFTLFNHPSGLIASRFEGLPCGIVAKFSSEIVE